jgi:hypothetical protein
MRNVWRKALVTGGIAVALMVGPGVGMASAAPLQLPIPPLPEVPLPQLPELPEGGLPALPQLPDLPALPDVAPAANVIRGLLPL